MIDADQGLDEALNEMARHQVRRLPVVEGERLVGVLAQADVAREAGDAQTGRVVEEISGRARPAARRRPAETLGLVARIRLRLPPRRRKVSTVDQAAAITNGAGALDRKRRCGRQQTKGEPKHDARGNVQALDG